MDQDNWRLFYFQHKTFKKPQQQLTWVLCYGGLTNKGLSLVFQFGFWLWVGLTFPVPTTTQSPKPLYVTFMKKLLFIITFLVGHNAFGQYKIDQNVQQEFDRLLSKQPKEIQYKRYIKGAIYRSFFCVQGSHPISPIFVKIGYIWK